ncbi:hypothetical protein AURDEDRAFT_164177 [Auricularia subglabra TFB-10046 SS5]|nr:hypothetical protein AURDEDRAFT_164177 [Auricularia subglabra TFB-10046 SS5]
MPGLCTRLEYSRMDNETVLGLLQCDAEFRGLWRVRIDVSNRRPPGSFSRSIDFLREDSARRDFEVRAINPSFHPSFDMALKATEYPRASAALSGLGLTTQLALAATDGVPVVKQIVGVAARIVTLAQDIEARRDALHALVKNAQAIGQRVEAATRDRELDGEMLSSLDALHSVLRSVAALLADHTAKTRFQRALRYAFTVHKDVDRLNQELSRAVQEFLATLDTNGHVKNNAKCIGKFRQLHDYEVEKLELVMEDKRLDSEYSIKYYKARIDGSGQVFALRFIERNAPTTSHEVTRYDERMQQRMIEHDRILEQLS